MKKERKPNAIHVESGKEKHLAEYILNDPALMKRIGCIPIKKPVNIQRSKMEEPKPQVEIKKELDEVEIFGEGILNEVEPVEEPVKKTSRRGRPRKKK